MSCWRQINTFVVDIKEFLIKRKININVNGTIWSLESELSLKRNFFKWYLKCTDIKENILVKKTEFSEVPLLERPCFKLFNEQCLAHYFSSKDLLMSVGYLELCFFEEKSHVTDATVKNDDPDQFESIENLDKNKELVNEYEQLSGDFSSFWQQKILTDVDIQCGSEVFKAHKAILAARSPFFAAMFQTPMKESQENVVEIKNTKPRIFQIVLSYLYSGQKPEMEDSKTVCEVMMAADLYNIPSLKLICSRFLRSVLSVANAVSLLVFTDLYDPEFKEDVVRFICDHFDSLKNTEEWVTLQKQNPSLVINVMMEKIQKLSLK